MQLSASIYHMHMMNIPQSHPTTALDICNLALAKLGEAPLNAINPNGNPASRLCYMHYHPARREVLVANRWSFAMASTIIRSADAPAEVGTDSACSVSHPLPTDCLRVLEVSSPGWTLRGRSIFCPATTIHVRYISDVEDPSCFDPLFTDAFCTLLACKLCIPLTASTTARQMLIDEYHRLVLPKAAHFNAVQQHSNDSHPLLNLLKNSAAYCSNCE